MKQLRHSIPALVLAVAGLWAAPASAGPYSGLVVFGDSVSDSGNVALAIGAPSGVPQVITGNGYIPDFPYYPYGRFSNGPVWAEDFAGKLGLSAAPSLAGGTDFAFAGARTAGPDVPVPTLTTQAGMFLAANQGAAPSGALYVIAEVGNDARDALAAIGAGADPAQTIHDAAAAYAGDVGAIVDTLRAAGAQQFLVFDNVNLGLVPAVTAMGSDAAGLATALTSAMNGALSARLQGEAGITLFDTFSFLTGVVQNPGAYGFANATDACGALAAADCSGYVFWDGLHPTAALHGLIAAAAFAAVVPEPPVFALMLAGSAVLLALRRRRGR
jgi:phospholipase/lecithinase/hemolysin